MPTEDHASMPAAPETTRLIAQRFEAVDLESGNVMSSFLAYPVYTHIHQC